MILDCVKRLYSNINLLKIKKFVSSDNVELPNRMRFRRLQNHLKVCCVAPGRIGSEKSSAVYLLCFHDDMVGYQYQYFFL